MRLVLVATELHYLEVASLVFVPVPVLKIEMMYDDKNQMSENNIFLKD